MRQSATLTDLAPRIGAAYVAEQAHRMRAISRCWQGGWHAHGAGPCFSTVEAAMRRRDREEVEWAEIKARRRW